jgi:hypothetical protein
MLFQKRRWDRELGDEMQLHLELLQTRFKAEGLSDAEAVRVARRRFGGFLRLREASADAWGWTWLAQLRQDLTPGPGCCGEHRASR